MEIAAKSSQIQSESPALPLTEKAAALVQQIQADPENASLYQQLGLALRTQLRFRDAIQAYSVGLTYAPFCKELYRHRGHAYLNLRRYSEGAADFEMALRLDPEYWDALYHQGLCFYLMGQYERAKKTLTRCIAVSKDDGSLISATDWYCLSLMQLGQIDEMKQAAARIRPDMIPGSGEGYFERCLAYNGTISLEEALRIAESRDDHMYATGAYGLGVYYQRVLGDSATAKAIWEKILTKDTTWAGFAEHATHESLKTV